MGGGVLKAFQKGEHCDGSWDRVFQLIELGGESPCHIQVLWGEGNRLSVTN